MAPIINTEYRVWIKPYRSKVCCFHFRAKDAKLFPGSDETGEPYRIEADGLELTFEDEVELEEFN